MKVNFIILFLMVSYLFLHSCSLDNMGFDIESDSEEVIVDTKSTDFSYLDRPMVLGDKLENPYTINNMRNAYQALEEQGSKPSFPISEIKITHYYVKFMPETVEEFNALEEYDGLELFDHPLDYEILQEGNYYRQPGIADSLPTWQYASISASDWFSINNSISISYDVLDSLCIELQSGNVVGKTSVNVDSYISDFEAVELMSFELTGNADEDILTKGSSSWTPSGRIMAFDNVVNGLIPLGNVKVRVNNFCKVSVGYTDEFGYFTCNKSYTAKVRYKIVWESDKWDIRDGSVLQAYYNDSGKRKGPWYLNIPNGDSKSLRYTVIHRALQRYYYGTTNGLIRPSNSFGKVKVAYYQKSGDGTYGDFRYYIQQLTFGIFPSIRIYGKRSNGAYRDLSSIYSTVSHEMAHASHYMNSKSNFKRSPNRLLESWARCVQVHLTDYEYEDLGVRDMLNEYVSVPIKIIQIGTNDTLSAYRKLIKPDGQYNFQNWKFTYTDETSVTYTPFFIDLMDDYNQSEYYSLNNQNEASCVPDDKISEIPISVLEDIILSSSSFSVVEQKLRDYVSSHEDEKKGITIENLQILLNCYNNE